MEVNLCYGRNKMASQYIIPGCEINSSCGSPSSHPWAPPPPSPCPPVLQQVLCPTSEPCRSFLKTPSTPAGRPPCPQLHTRQEGPHAWITLSLLSLLPPAAVASEEVSSHAGVQLCPSPMNPTTKAIQQAAASGVMEGAEVRRAME